MRRVHVIQNLRGHTSSITVPGHALQRFAFQNQVFTVVEDSGQTHRVKNKKTAVDVGGA